MAIFCSVFEAAEEMWVSGGGKDGGRNGRGMVRDYLARVGSALLFLGATHKLTHLVFWLHAGSDQMCYHMLECRRWDANLNLQREEEEEDEAEEGGA